MEGTGALALQVGLVGVAVLRQDVGPRLAQELPSYQHDPGGDRVLRTVFACQIDVLRLREDADLDLNVAGAALLGGGAGLNFLADRPVAPVVLAAQVGGLQAAVRADGDGGDALGPLKEALVLQPLVELLHHQFPDHGGRVFPMLDKDLLRLVLVAHPHGGGVIGGIAREVPVAVIGGGTGLTGDGHTAEGGVPAGTAGDHPAQQLVHQVGGGFLHSRPGLRDCVVDHSLLVVVALNAGNEMGLNIGPPVNEGAVGSRHFHGGHAIGQSAHSQRGQVDVVDIQLEAQVVLHEFKGLGVPQLLQCPGGDGVGRVLQAPRHGRISPVAPIGVAGIALFPEGIVDGVVVNDAGGTHHVGVNGRGVSRHRLDGASRHTRRGRQALGTVDRLHAHVTGDGLHLAGVGVDNRDGRVDGRALLGGIVKVGRILKHLVHYGLHLRVQGGVDVESAPVEQLGGVLPGIAVLLRQQGDGLVDGLILKPCVDLAEIHGLLVVRLLGDLDAMESLVLVGVGENEFFRLGGGVLSLGEIAVLLHLFQDEFLTHFVEVPGRLDAAVILLKLFLKEGIIEGWVVGDAYDGGALRHAQFADVLAEISLGGGLDAVGPRAEIDRVQVVGDDVLLAHALLVLQGPADLPELPAHGDVCVIVHLPQQLLGDGGAAPGVSVEQGVPDGGDGAHPVHAVMLPEPVVLNGDQRVDEVPGNLAVLHQLPVAAGVIAVVIEGEEGGPVLVVDGGGQSQLHLLRRNLSQGGDEGGVHIGHKDFGENTGGQYADDTDGEHCQKDPSDRLGDYAANGALLFLLVPGRGFGGRALFRPSIIILIHNWVKIPPFSGLKKQGTAFAKGFRATHTIYQFIV